MPSDTAIFRAIAAQLTPPRRRWTTPGAMARKLDPSTRTTPALDLIDRELVTLFDSDTHDRLMLFMPPQEGKSQKVSRRTPAWLLADDPTLRIAIVSYEQGKAERWGRAIRRDIRVHPELGITLRPDTQAAGRWETTAGGGLICVGIEGGITGEPVDVLIIDDPVKGRAQAESQTYREAAWDWWESNGSTRLSSRGKVVLMMTRWHADDLAGRLLANEADEWRVVSIPAIAEDADDPLGRQPGEELPSVQDRQPGHFHRLQLKRSGYVFRSIFQQRPVAASGNVFQRGDWQFWQQLPGQRMRLGDYAEVDRRDCFRFITMDLATSMRTSADYTVASAWGIAPSGELILLDRLRERVPESSHAEFLRPLRERWLGPGDVTFIESRMFGTTLVYALGRANVPIGELEADKDKLTRAVPAADLQRAHRVFLPAHADWLDEWLDEHAEFPNGKHDDQVDTFAYAARIAHAHWLPMESAEQTDSRIASSDDVDFMRVAF